MPKPTFKALVQNQILHDLATYWDYAEEHEDPKTLNSLDVKARAKDFYLYMHEVTK